MEKRHFYEFGPFRLDSQSCVLWARQEVVSLEPKVAETLLALVKAKGQVVLKATLIDQVWGKATFVNENALARNIHYLRQQLRAHLDGTACIKTVPTRGYRLILPVTERWEDALHDPVPPPSKPAETAPVSQVAILNPEPAARLHLEAVSSGNSANSTNSTNSQPGWRRPRYIFLTLGSLVALTAVLALRFTPAAGLRVAQYVALTNNGWEKGGPPLTDGSRVYFTEQDPDGLRLASVAIAGGESWIMPCPLCENAALNDLSPFRSELLLGRPPSSFQNGSELWEVPLFGGTPRRLGNLTAKSAKWSPDRRQLASARGQGLYISDAEGSNEKKIAEVPGQSIWPHWSPDGKTLRFTEQVYRNGEVYQSIWEVRADGSNLHRLLDGWNNHHECCGSWTPDGRLFIFESTREGRSDLWALSEKRGLFGSDSGSPVRLSSGLQGFSSATVSADGKQVFALGYQPRGELVRYEPRLREFVPFLGGISATWVSFSRSGGSVVYIDYPNLTVWRADADGSKKKQITFAPLQAEGLCWSPDERWLAVRARTPEKKFMIYLVPSQGGKAQLLLPGEKEQGIPAWSADGKKIAFGDVPSVFGQASGTETIHILDLSTHTLSELAGSRGLWTARWSPDGRTLSALTIAEPERIMLYDFTTKRWRSTKADYVNNPTWSADSKYIYFGTVDERALRRVRISDGHVDELVNMQGFPALAWSWSGVARDNSPIVLRNLGSTEVYALTLEPK